MFDDVETKNTEKNILFGTITRNTRASCAEKNKIGVELIDLELNIFGDRILHESRCFENLGAPTLFSSSDFYCIRSNTQGLKISTQLYQYQHDIVDKRTRKIIDSFCFLRL